jgi:hypothetical protein
MVQQIIIGLIFAGSIAFLVRMIYHSFQAKHACTTGCGKCGAIDFKKIETQINSKIAIGQKPR